MSSQASRQFRVALLHLAPRPEIEHSITKAAEAGASWIITPELAVSGYTFVPTAGINWISPQPDAWMLRICDLAARLRVHIFLSLPEKDETTAKLHNATFVIGPNGEVRGKHRKINTLGVGSEAWSSPGANVDPITIDHDSAVVCLQPHWTGRHHKLHQLRKCRRLWRQKAFVSQVGAINCLHFHLECGNPLPRRR